MRKTKAAMLRLWVQLQLIWGRITGKPSGRDLNEAETKIMLFKKSLQHLITARSLLKQHKISIDVYYQGTRLKSGKTLAIKVVSDWLKDAEFINDTATADIYRKQIEKFKKEL